MDATETAWWFEEMGTGLVLYARQIAGESAEDVVQEVFMRLVRQEKKPANVKAWLLLAARRQALDLIKGTRRRAVRDREAGGMFETGVNDPRGLAEDVAAGLKDLALEEREIVTLRIWNEATFEEIGEVMGLAVSTVYHRYRTGLEKLRTRLELPCRKK